ncbi:MAG TPA: glycosyltransferase family 4 protein [Gaiellales bacterium]|nr:glycosyltransferase family 4 protein [Gaiellales bacterium]
MRILYLSADPGVPVLGHKGASVHVRELAQAMEQCGAMVAIASPRVGDEGAHFRSEVTLASIPPVLPKQLTDAGLRYAMEEQSVAVERIARGLHADVIYERFSLFSVAGVRAASRLSIPHVLEVNAPLRAEAARFRTLPHPEMAALAEREVLAGTDAIYAVSAALAEWLQSMGCTAPIEVMPNAIDPSQFSGRAQGLGDRFVVGFAGSLKPWHGIDVMLEACQSAMSEQPSLRLEIVGDGPMRSAIDRAVLPKYRVTVFGHVDHAEAIRMMQGWHAGLAPYHDVPGFYFSPLKVVEYMAAGVCPVASDLGQIRDLLGGGSRGVLVRPGDAASLARALVDLATEPAVVEQLASAAREYVLSTHTWQGNATRVIDVVHALCARRAA